MTHDEFKDKLKEVGIKFENRHGWKLLVFKLNNISYFVTRDNIIKNFLELPFTKYVTIDQALDIIYEFEFKQELLKD